MTGCGIDVEILSMLERFRLFFGGDHVHGVEKNLMMARVESWGR